jgi:hypothetical protein
MKIHTCLLLTAVIIVFQLPVLGAQLDMARQALTSLDETSLEGWAFTETTVRNGTETVAHYDPSRPEGERWTLHTVDGRQPTDDEIEKFEKQRSGRHREEDEEDEEQGFSAVIEAESLVSLKDSPTHAVYRFKPSSGEEGEDDGMSEHLDGLLRISKEGPFVESLEMRSREPFSPAFSVKIKEFSTVMTFAPVGEERTVLPESVKVRMVGRAMLLKKLDETVETRFSDYRFVGQPE